DSLTLSQIEGMVQKGETGFLTDLSTLFKELPVIRVPAEEDILLRNGNYLTYPASVIASQSGQRPCEGDRVRMELSDGTLAGLYRISEIFPEGKRSIREEAVRVTAFKMFV
ncbi:MAG: hypothetical protein J6P72_03625, partial [Firmicutes bacterium]|nr:hypothetical protein [Bacillota bacterium]